MSTVHDGHGRPLEGWRVLVPRGGPWGHGVASDLRAQRANPLVAPMINYAATDDPDRLQESLDALSAGAYDWVTLASSTTVDVLLAQQVAIAESTKVAAVGETTAASLSAAGYRVDLVPSDDNSAHGLLAEWKAATGGIVPLRILSLTSATDKPILTEGLKRIGHSVDAVTAYRTVGVPAPSEVVDDVAAGRINAILVTSGSVAKQVRQQFGDVPESVLIAAVGPRTAKDAARAGLRVDVTAEENTSSSLIAALVDCSGSITL